MTWETCRPTAENQTHAKPQRKFTTHSKKTVKLGKVAPD